MQLKEYIIKDKTYYKSFDFYTEICTTKSNYTHWVMNIIHSRGVIGTDYIIDYEDHLLHQMPRRQLRYYLTIPFCISLSCTVNKPRYKKMYTYLIDKHGRN